MAQAKRDDPLFTIANELGKLVGAQTGFQAELARLNNELEQLRAEQDSKHRENLDQVGKYHEQNVRAIADHQAEDNENFKDVRHILHRLWFSGLGAAGAIAIVWAVVQFAVTFLKH